MLAIASVSPITFAGSFQVRWTLTARNDHRDA